MGHSQDQAGSLQAPTTATLYPRSEGDWGQNRGDNREKGLHSPQLGGRVEAAQGRGRGSLLRPGKGGRDKNKTPVSASCVCGWGPTGIQATGSMSCAHATQEGQQEGLGRPAGEGLGRPGAALPLKLGANFQWGGGGSCHGRGHNWHQEGRVLPPPTASPPPPWPRGLTPPPTVGEAKTQRIWVTQQQGADCGPLAATSRSRPLPSEAPGPPQVMATAHW